MTDVPMLPLAIAIGLALGCSKKKEEGGGGGSGESGGSSDPNATYTLKLRGPQQGDKIEVISSETSELDFSGKGEALKQQKKYDYVEHIQEMPAGAKMPTKLTRMYKVAQRTDFATKQMKPLPFEGKTITIEKTKDGYEYTMDGKKLNRFDVFEIDSDLRREDGKEISALLPRQPVKVGDTWTVDMEAAKSLAGGMNTPGIDASKSKFNCKLAKVYTKDSHQWGVIEFDFHVVVEPKAGKGPDLGSGSVKMTGSFDTVIDGSARDGTMKGNIQGSFSGKEKDKEVKGTVSGSIEKTVKTVK